jgi:hypothetical protein
MQALQRICPCQVHCHSRTLELPAAPSCLGARPPALGPRVGGFLFPSLLHRRARRKAGRKAQDLRIMFQGRKAQGRDARRKALEPRTLSLGQPTTGQGKGLRAPKQKQATGAEGLYLNIRNTAAVLVFNPCRYALLWQILPYRVPEVRFGASAHLLHLSLCHQPQKPVDICVAYQPV